MKKQIMQMITTVLEKPQTQDRLLEAIERADAVAPAIAMLAKTLLDKAMERTEQLPIEEIIGSDDGFGMADFVMAKCFETLQNLVGDDENDPIVMAVNDEEEANKATELLEKMYTDPEPQGDPSMQQQEQAPQQPMARQGGLL